jgi:hypothetical protein
MYFKYKTMYTIYIANSVCDKYVLLYIFIIANVIKIPFETCTLYINLYIRNSNIIEKL